MAAKRNYWLPETVKVRGKNTLEIRFEYEFRVIARYQVTMS